MLRVLYAIQGSMNDMHNQICPMCDAKERNGSQSSGGNDKAKKKGTYKPRTSDKNSVPLQEEDEVDGRPDQTIAGRFKQECVKTKRRHSKTGTR